jgi:hypothetical protein
LYASSGHSLSTTARISSEVINPLNLAHVFVQPLEVGLYHDLAADDARPVDAFLGHGRKAGCPAILAHAFHLSQLSWNCAFASSIEAARPSARTPAHGSTTTVIDQNHRSSRRVPTARSSYSRPIR